MDQAVQSKNQGLEKGIRSLAFGDYRIDLVRRVLLRSDSRINIQKKPLSVLIYLIQEAPRMVSREELLRRFWSRAVNEETLTRCVSTIRKRLADNEDPPRFIETHRAQGYRFIADVNASSQGAPGIVEPASKDQRWPVIAAAIMLCLIAWLWFDRLPNEIVAGRVERIAVLPLTVPDASSDWLKPALSDHLMQAVSRIEGVTVVSSSADPDSLDIKAHGTALGVEAILLARLERTSYGSALSATLVAIEDNALLWSATVESAFELSSGDQVQDIARQLAVRLRPTLQISEQKPSVNQRAYSYYLQGRYYWGQRSAIGLEAAIAAYSAALAIDPNYTDALLGSAESWLLMPLYGAAAPVETIPTARNFAQRALELDPASERARSVLGAISMQYDWNWTKAESLLREAVSLNPNNATAQQWLGELFCYTSRFAECSRQFRVALDLDPLSPVLRMQQGSPSFYAGNYAAALAAYSETARLTPEFPLGRYVVGLACAGLADWNGAILAYRSSLPDLGLEIVGGPLVYALSKAGEHEEARLLLDELVELAGSRYVPPSKIAIAYLGVGDRDKALDELRRAVQMRDDRLVYLATEVHFRDLIAEPGFEDIVSQIGL